MTENMIMAMEAINKFMYYSWNYNVIYHTWINCRGEKVTKVIPEFIAKVKWSCGIDHILEKWYVFTSKTNDANAYMPRFYAELDDKNRQLLLEWVMTNYNNEKKIF